MQPIQLQFTYTEAEYVSAARLLMLREKNTVIRLTVFFVLILLGAVLLTITQGFLFPLWAAVLIALLFDLVLVYRIFVDMPKKYFRGDPKLGDEYRLTF